MDYLDVTQPNYSYVFNFEEKFIHQDTRDWMTNNWTNGFYACGIYMILIFGGQYWMSSRPRYELRGVLSLWNTMLATFSIIGFTRTAPELIHVLRNYGIYHSVCIPRYDIIFVKEQVLFSEKKTKIVCFCQAAQNCC